MLHEEGYDAVVFYGNAGFETNFHTYLTNYEPRAASYLVGFADPEEAPTLYVGISNHLQYVREVSTVDDLELMLHDPPKKVADRLTEAGVEEGTIGLVGVDPRYDNGMPYTHYEELEARIDADLENATASFAGLTAVKSEAERARIRRLARCLDSAMEALEAQATPGMTEHDLYSIVASSVDDDCTITSPFISTAPMEDAEPGECLPWKDEAADRILEAGDVINTEISARCFGYGSQIHRPYAVGTTPTDRYRDIFDVTRETYERMIDALRPGNTTKDVHEAMGPIENSEYKSYDVMLHGYGNGYQHPFVGTSASNYWPGAEDPVTGEWTFEEGMVMVVQPNAFTEDERYGLQFGTTVVIGDDGPEVIQDYPAEFVGI